MSEVAIKVENLSKAYTIWTDPAARLKHPFLDMAGELFPAMRAKIDKRMEGLCKEFYALKDVSFEVNKGQSVGIIGRNGSGKSTLLQIIAGTLQPTEGRVTVNGRVAALLELGSGFNPEFTGRENVYLNATILGFSKKEIDNTYDIIHEFSGIEEFIEQPVKTYSSGMIARLAFSVVVQLRPDILIVDEALSVGDMSFQEKSITKMKEIRELGTTILFVSHSSSAVRNFCDIGVWLDKGRIRNIGNSNIVSTQYENEINKELSSSRKIAATKNISHLKEDCRVAISNIYSSKNEYNSGEDICIAIKLKINEKNILFGVGLILKDIRGNIVSILNTLRDDVILNENNNQIEIVIKDNHLCSGEYYISIIVSDELGMCAYDKREDLISFKISEERSKRGLLINEGITRFDKIWKI